MVVVYDVRGRRVRGLLQGRGLDPGFYRLFWDGRSDSGLPVSPGVYFVVAQSGDWNATRKLVRLGR
jgi:hypothetical protein